MTTIILENVYVVEAIGVAHIQCMCESCHYYASYGREKKYEHALETREQYFETRNNNCKQCQMLLIAKTDQWKQIPDINDGTHIANALAEKFGKQSHLEGVRILESGTPFDMNDILYRKGCIEKTFGEYSIGWLWRNIHIPDVVDIPLTLMNFGECIEDMFDLMDRCFIEKCDVKLQYVTEQYGISPNVADVYFRKCKRVFPKKIIRLLNESKLASESSD